LKAGVRAVQSTPLVSPSGKVLGMFSTHYKIPHRPDERKLVLLDLLARQAADIVENKHAEEALAKAKKRAEEDNRAKDNFLAILGHELRNPLTPIRNAIAILQHGGAPETVLASARDVIDRQVSHMSRLIDDLLDVSRIARGKISLRDEDVDLVEKIK